MDNGGYSTLESGITAQVVCVFAERGGRIALIDWEERDGPVGPH